jgi:hypothetical protein
VLRDSQAYMYGTVSEIFSQADKLKETDLTVPQITNLFLELENRGLETESSVYNVEQAKGEILSLMKMNMKMKK